MGRSHQAKRENGLSTIAAKRWGLAAVLVVLLTGCSAATESRDSTASMPAPTIAGAPAGVAEMKQTEANTVPQAAGASNAPAMNANNPLNEAASTAQQADSINGTSMSETATERKIIYRASVTMQVDKYEEAQSKIESEVSLAGGYILQFNENETAYEKNGTFTIKVPANGFQSLMKKLEAMNPSAKKNMQGQDVSEEFVDLSSRLKAKQLVESRLISFMEKAAKTDELLAFSNELGKVQEEIERIKGRMRYLEQNVAYSTIEVRIAQKLGSAAVIQANEHGPLFQRAASALNESALVLLIVLQWIVVAAAAVLPIVAVLALIGIPIVMVIRRSKKKKILEIRNKLLEENSETEPNMSQVMPEKETDELKL